MSDASGAGTRSLEHLAREQSIQDADLRACWQLVVRGIEYGMIGDEADLQEVLDHLRQGRDIVLEELGFEFIGGKLRVRLLDEKRFCRPQDMIAQLEELRARYAAGGS